jgi:methyl-accepting chemotaxis protein
MNDTMDATPLGDRMSDDVREKIAGAAEVCRRAADGDLESRILGIEGDGVLAELLHSVNHLLDMTDAFTRESTATLEAASQDEFHRLVRPEGLRGAFGRAALKINAAVRHMAAESEELARAEAERRRLAEELAATSRLVEDLTRASLEIGQVSRVIDTIAGQTNLLALNAAIETARVGVAGKGFGVVASEVKRLAQQTTAATHQIEDLVAAIQHSTGQVDSAIRQISEAIRHDTDTSETALETRTPLVA